MKFQVQRFLSRYRHGKLYGEHLCRILNVLRIQIRIRNPGISCPSFGLKFNGGLFLILQLLTPASVNAKICGRAIIEKNDIKGGGGGPIIIHSL